MFRYPFSDGNEENCEGDFLVLETSHFSLNQDTVGRVLPCIPMVCLCLFLLKKDLFPYVHLSKHALIEGLHGWPLQIMYRYCNEKCQEFRRWPSPKEGMNGMNNNHNPHHFLSCFCWLSNLRTEEQKIYAVGKNPRPDGWWGWNCGNSIEYSSMVL